MQTLSDRQVTRVCGGLSNGTEAIPLDGSLDPQCPVAVPPPAF